MTGTEIAVLVLALGFLIVAAFGVWAWHRDITAQERQTRLAEAMRDEHTPWNPVIDGERPDGV